MATMKKGQEITLSTTEVAYELTGATSYPVTTLTILLVSGTMQYTVAPSTAAPILDSTYATYSTAGDKVLVDMQPGSSTLRLRCASAGVVRVSW